MRFAQCSELYNRVLRATKASVIGSTVALLSGTTSAIAIPSPELIVGSFTSISQLIALASAFIGGGAAIVAMRARGTGVARTTRALIAVTAAAVVLLITSVGFNIYQYVDQRNERQARLQDTILRPSRTPGSLPLDPENQEWSYAQQTKSPLALTTQEVDELLQATARGERDDLIFLDVRETAEREIGTLPGVKFVRYPDIPAASMNFSGKKAVLFCHNGNRSNEVCNALKKQGIDCRFMLGGLEKWVVEGRAMDGLGTRTLEQLRAIPRYPNDRTLLDTPEVRRLVADEKAIFVDVRYPLEFQQHGHLPEAINLTVRRIPTAELPKHIAALPKRPIILPCYDRRGCFFAEILGYELSRAGHDVRGRFTLPWTYFVPPGRPPHVEQWIKENHRSVWVKAGRQLAGVLSAVSEWTGLVLAILLLALASRILVLPFSAKAERDQIRSRAAADELATLKTRLKDDPVRRSRAIRAFYKRLGLTPVRNLVALLFLPIMAIALIAVQEVVAGGGDRFLWIPDLAERDPWLILPILFAALIALYVHMALARKTSHRVTIWAIGFPLLVGTGALFSAGADLYLVASALLLLLQRTAVAGGFAELYSLWRRLWLGRDIISLDEPGRLLLYGNKAYRLAQMRSQGLPVPRGILLTPSFLEEFALRSPEWRRRRLDRVWRWLGRAPLAVRSSASAEDNERQSFAGVFDSVLNVDREGLEATITRVRASFDADRARSYGAGESSGSILIQRMVAAEYAGVLFTRDPAAGGLALIELVRGTAQDLVSGAVRPATYRLGRASGEVIGEGVGPVDLKALHTMGRKAERLFGAAQDIEWTYNHGGFQLVQSRDITRSMSDQSATGLIRREMAQALDLADGLQPDEIAFAKNEFSEMLPRPTPLSLSLMETFWKSGGSVDLAARALNLSYQVSENSTDYLLTILGRLYVNKREERARLLRAGFFAARRLARGADRIEHDFRESFLPRFLGELRLAESANFEKLSTPELFDALARLRHKFVHETHVEVDIVNIATNFYIDRARGQLISQGLDPSSYLGHIPETYEARAFVEMTRAPSEYRHGLLLSTMGHRSVLDYELSEPRYAQNPSALDRIFQFDPAASAHRAETKMEQPKLGKALARSVDIARRFQALKEDAKHHSLRELAVLRQAILALDRRLDLDGLSFFLRFDELLGLREQSVVAMREIAMVRQRERARMTDMVPLPATVTVRELEAISAGGDAIHHDSDGLIRGTRVSGTGTAEGRARVITDTEAERGNPIEGFEDGDIIVTSMVHPSWLPYFSRAGGFVCEVGGWLSHTAILAREYDVAMVVNTHGITLIPDGGLLRLHPGGAIDIVGKGGRVSATAAE
jgi:rhodanese-related sulfurtransferase/phosphohistidine swiveling domain-containing protein